MRYGRGLLISWLKGVWGDTVAWVFDSDFRSDVAFQRFSKTVSELELMIESSSFG